MKPLSNAAAASALCNRILGGEGGIIRAVRITDPSAASLTLSVQDKQRGFDWIDLTFEMRGMIDAKVLDDKQLDFLDTEDGITIVFEDGVWGFGIGRYGGLQALKSAPLYLIGTSLKYEESPFSG